MADEDFLGAKMYFSSAKTRPASPLVASVNTADCLQTLVKLSKKNESEI